MTITFASRYYPQAAERFVLDAADHTMQVLHDDGLYRHLRFRAPGTSIYGFDIVTWPGYLSITGDVGAFTFARLTDMFEFFDARSVDINPGYWGEKVVAEDTRSRGIRSYSASVYRRHVADVVREHIEYGDLTRDEAHALWLAVREELFDDAAEYEETARAALDAFRHGGLEFRDTWEWDLRDWTWTFLWSCCAIRWGIQQYRAARPAEIARAAA